MLTTDDLIDAILEVLAPPKVGIGDAPLGHGPADENLRRDGRNPRGRPFLSEYDVKKALTPGAQQLTIPKEAIISPLALDWLALKDIRIVRE